MKQEETVQAENVLATPLVMKEYGYIKEVYVGFYDDNPAGPLHFIFDIRFGAGYGATKYQLTEEVKVLMESAKVTRLDALRFKPITVTVSKGTVTGFKILEECIPQ